MDEKNMVESVYLSKISECHNIIDQIEDRTGIMVVPIPLNATDKLPQGSQLMVAIEGLKSHLTELRDKIQ